ncbi:MAG: hypothetical protein ABIV47_27845 [Roseiflexaceae bacterium]
MNRKLLIGIAGSALALALAGGAAYAGPSLNRSLAATQAATPTVQPSGNATGADAARTGRGRQRGKAALLTGALIKASAQVTATKPKEVLVALGDGKTLSQYATDHGKSTADVIAAARKNVQDRLNQALGNGKLTQERVDALLKQFDDSAPRLMADANLGKQIGRAVAKRHPVAAVLVKATADVTGTKPADVLVALKQGQSLAQYAQAHGKTADDILAKLREQGQLRLDKRLDQAKELIETPGLGRDGQPNNASPTATPSE